MTKRPFDTLPAPQQAGILCTQDHFAVFLADRYGHYTAPADFVRTHCGITSRRDLASDPFARDKFDRLRTEYDAWRGKIGTP